jgi:hypothetical protein
MKTRGSPVRTEPAPPPRRQRQQRGRGQRLRLGQEAERQQRALLDRPWKVKFLQGVILLVVLAGAATGPLALLSGAKRAPAQTAANTAPPSSVGATGFAQLFVATWLGQADPDHPEKLTAFDPYVSGQDLTGMVPGVFYASGTVAIDATPASRNYWAVTVAADVFETTKSSVRSLGTRYYAVGVGVARGRYIATSLPEQIDPPAVVDPPPTMWVSTLSTPGAGDPMADSLTQFFSAMLTGKSQLAPYVDPKSGLVALTPAPYTVATLKAYGQAPTGTGLALAKAQVLAVDAANHTTVLEYWLDMEQVQGRWVVARLHRAGPIAPAGQDPQQTQ